MENEYKLWWKNKKKIILFNTKKKSFAHHKCGSARGPTGQPVGRDRSEEWTWY